MHKLSTPLALSLCCSISPAAFALDDACAPIVAASEARMKAPAWHTVSETSTHFKVESIKADGNYFSRVGDGKWNTSINIDQAEEKMLAGINTGGIKLTQCKDEGTEAIAGVTTRVISYQIEIKDGPSASSRLNIGQADGLPYAATSNGNTTHYAYTGVVAPKP